ncbi:MAG: hypothetical protein SVX43_10530 [Cyanobacteriota bacterium]|nr:hypothetical protein [Cyanobacteriota bacterium]
MTDKCETIWEIDPAVLRTAYETIEKLQPQETAIAKSSRTIKKS